MKFCSFVIAIHLLFYQCQSYLTTNLIQRISWRSNSPKLPARRKTTQLNIDLIAGTDDLPSILGINPIEALIIGVVLYYIYGPTVLYDYAREAGKFVTTYLPIVQDISKNIFLEFRDYLDEEKERELLVKQGFNVENIPRRTSNIFERFTEGYKAIQAELQPKDNDELRRAFTEERESLNNSSDEGDDLEEDSSIKKKKKKKKIGEDKRRKSKKDVLIESDIDVEKVMQAVAPDESEEIKESLSAIKEQWDARPKIAPPPPGSSPSGNPFWNMLSDPQQSTFTQPLPPPPSYWELSDGGSTGTAVDGDGDSSRMTYPNFDMLNPPYNNYNDNDDMTNVGPGEFRDRTSSPSYYPPPPPPVSAATSAATKFQQQLSGSWNQQVMMQQQQQQQQSSYFSTDASASLNPYSNAAPPPNDRREPPAFSINDNSLNGTTITSNIPDLDLQLDMLSRTSTTRPLSASSSELSSLSVSVLQELDKDYLALRRKLLDLIEIQQFKNTPNINDNNNSSSSNVENSFKDTARTVEDNNNDLIKLSNVDVSQININSTYIQTKREEGDQSKDSIITSNVSDIAVQIKEANFIKGENVLEI